LVYGVNLGPSVRGAFGQLRWFVGQLEQASDPRVLGVRI